MAIATNSGDSRRAATATTAALDYAAANGFDSVTDNTVTVNIPPASGAYSGNSDHAEVVISATVRTAFIRLLGSRFETVTVSARAVGGNGHIEVEWESDVSNDSHIPYLVE